MVVAVSLLRENEAIIEKGLASFVEVGNAFMRIREGELYREDGFDGFVEYLASKPWGISPATAYREIDAAKVSHIVGNGLNSRQANELAPLLRKSTPAVVQQVYDEVVSETEGHPTAAAIREKVQPMIHTNGKEAPRRSKVDDQLEQHLEEIKKLIPRWERRFVDSHSGREAQRRVRIAEEIISWLTAEYVPAHAALVTPLAKVPS